MQLAFLRVAWGCCWVSRRQLWCDYEFASTVIAQFLSPFKLWAFLLWEALWGEFREWKHHLGTTIEICRYRWIVRTDTSGDGQGIVLHQRFATGWEECKLRSCQKTFWYRELRLNQVMRSYLTTSYLHWLITSCKMIKTKKSGRVHWWRAECV